MARAVDKGLRYFPKDVDYYSDDRIMDLLDGYGPLGQTVYDVLLSMVYREGYYLEMAPDRLARHIIRWIGSRWVQSREEVVKVLDFIAGVGLIDESLYRQGVITSAAIQRRYDEVTARRKTDRSKYWLLEKETADSAAESAPNVPATVPSATETPLFAAESTQRKEKEIKQKEISKREGEKGNSAGLPAPPVPPSPAKRYGHYQNVYLTDAEYASLQSELGQSLPLYIDKLSNHIASSGSRYASHEATIRKWFTDDASGGKAPRQGCGAKAFRRGGLPLEAGHNPSFDLGAFEQGGFELLDLPDAGG